MFTPHWINAGFEPPSSTLSPMLHNIPPPGPAAAAAAADTRNPPVPPNPPVPTTVTEVMTLIQNMLQTVISNQQPGLGH